MFIKLISKKKAEKNCNYYTIKDIVQYYDVDKYDIYAKSQEVGLEQLSSLHISDFKCDLFTTVIDIGCGTGNALFKLLQRFPVKDVFGVDLAPDMLAIAKEKINDLNAICDSADNICQHFKPDFADLIIINFVFAYLDYRKVIHQTTNVLKPNGVISICTNTANSFRWLQDISVRKPTRRAAVVFYIVNFIFKINCYSICNDFSKLMPKNIKSLVHELDKNNFSVYTYEELKIKVSLTNWLDMWNFIHNSGWFIGAIKDYKINKFKAFCLYYLAKICGLFDHTNGKFEDEMTIAVITAVKNE